MQKKKKFKPDFSSVIKLLILLFGQSYHVASTGSLQLPQHSWVLVVTTFVFKESLWATFLQFSCLYKWSAFWNAHDPPGIQAADPLTWSLAWVWVEDCAKAALQPCCSPVPRIPVAVTPRDPPPCQNQVSLKKWNVNFVLSVTDWGRSDKSPGLITMFQFILVSLMRTTH